MDFKEIIQIALDEYKEDLLSALDGLTAEERRFQPTPESNHIDFTVWHMARVEDDWIQRFAQGADTIWQREDWYTKLGLPERDSGFGYNAEQIKSLPQYDFDTLLAYYGAVGKVTSEYVKGLTPEDLDHVPRPDRRPGYTIGKMFSHVIIEEAQHVGHVAYLRGMQRGLDK